MPTVHTPSAHLKSALASFAATHGTLPTGQTGKALRAAGLDEKSATELAKMTAAERATAWEAAAPDLPTHTRNQRITAPATQVPSRSGAVHTRLAAMTEAPTTLSSKDKLPGFARSGRGTTDHEWNLDASKSVTRLGAGEQWLPGTVDLHGTGKQRITREGDGFLIHGDVSEHRASVSFELEGTTHTQYISKGYSSEDTASAINHLLKFRGYGVTWEQRGSNDTFMRFKTLTHNDQPKPPPVKKQFPAFDHEKPVGTRALKDVLGDAFSVYEFEGRTVSTRQPLTGDAKALGKSLGALAEAVFENNDGHSDTGFGAFKSVTADGVQRALMTPEDGIELSDIPGMFGGDEPSKANTAFAKQHFAKEAAAGAKHFIASAGNGSSEWSGFVVATVGADQKSVRFMIVQTSRS